MHWPQVIYLAISLIGVGISLAEHGKPKEGKHSVFVTLFATVVGYVLLYKGGFFTGCQ